MDLLPRIVGVSLAASIALLALPAAGQIINVQPLISAQKRHDGFTVVAEASADVRSGNTRLVALSGNGMVELREGRHLFFLLGRGDFAEKSGEPFVSKDLEHLRYRIALNAPFEAEAFVQHDRDDFRRLALRVLIGGGPRLHLQPFAGFEAAVGAAVLVEHERLGRGREPDAGATGNDVRLSTYLFLSSELGPQLKLGNTTYVQPRLDSFADIRLYNEIAVIAKATAHLAVKLTFTSAYDARPPAAVIPLDSTLKASLQVNF